MVSVTSVFTEAPDANDEGGKIQIILSNGNTLDLSVGDCIEIPSSDGKLRKRKIASFNWGNMTKPVIPNETVCTGINFQGDYHPIIKRDFDRDLKRIDCSQLNSASPGPNRRKTRKPTKKVRRNRRANSRRN